MSDCAVCGGGPSAPLAVRPYVQCQACGVVARDEPDVPRELPPLTEEQFDRGFAYKYGVNAERFAWLRHHAELVTGHAADIGSKDGSMLRVLLDAGWQATGYDPDVRWHAYAAARGIRIRADLFSVTTTAPNSLQLVTAFHVLEHVRPPAPLLTAIRRALAPEGVMYIETPNARRIQQRQLAPGHVLLYTAATLEQTVRNAGFSVVALTEHAPGGPRTYDQLALVARRDEAPAAPVWRFASADRMVPRAVARTRDEWKPTGPRLRPSRILRAIPRRLGTSVGRWRYQRG